MKLLYNLQKILCDKQDYSILSSEEPVFEK